MAAIHNRGQRLHKKMVLAVVQHHKEGQRSAGERRAASARSRCPGGNGRRGDGASSQASRPCRAAAEPVQGTPFHS